MNPRELLPDYVLGLLSPEEALAVEKYLEGSSNARAELQALQKTFINISESTLAATPQTSYQDLQRRLASAKSSESKIQPARVKPSHSFWYKELRDWHNYAVAASLALAILGLSWGWNARQEAKHIEAENATLNEWLAYGDLMMVSLKDQTDNPIGTVLVSPRDYALFILNTPPPAGKSYQAWGRANGTITSLAITEDRLIPVKSEGFERIGVSLEPQGGSPQPTNPLGGIPLN
jgi:anti-sigma-K factor RskA